MIFSNPVQNYFLSTQFCKRVNSFLNQIEIKPLVTITFLLPLFFTYLQQNKTNNKNDEIMI